MAISAGIMAAAAVVGVGASVISADKQAKAQAQAQQQAKAAADATALANDRAMNKANQKNPDVTGILAANQQAMKGGQSGTLSSGPTGVDPSALTLSKTTLLGS